MRLVLPHMSSGILNLPYYSRASRHYWVRLSRYRMGKIVKLHPISSSEQRLIADCDLLLREDDVTNATPCLPSRGIDDELDPNPIIISVRKLQRVQDCDVRLCADNTVASTLVAREFESDTQSNTSEMLDGFQAAEVHSTTG